MPTNNSYTLSYSLIVLLLCFNLCIMIPSVHITYITPVHPGEWSSSVALLKVSSLFSPWRVVWKFFLIRCEVLGQGCLYLQIVKHSETNLWKWAIQINWIVTMLWKQETCVHVAAHISLFTFNLHDVVYTSRRDPWCMYMFTLSQRHLLGQLDFLDYAPNLSCLIKVMAWGYWQAHFHSVKSPPTGQRKSALGKSGKIVCPAGLRSQLREPGSSLYHRRVGTNEDPHIAACSFN